MCKTSLPDTDHPRPLRALARGFSLLEVVLAVGIFSVAIVMVIAMLASGLRTQSNITDRGTAGRMAEAINAKLMDLGYEVLQGNQAKNLPGLLFPSGQNPDSPGDTTSQNSKVLFMNKTGDKIGTYTDPIWGTPGSNNAEKYYEIMLVRTPSAVFSPQPDAAGSDLNAITASSVLFTVRVTWPAFLMDADGRVTEQKDRSTRGVFVFNAAVSR
jgi:prepilin-type N-terminal cleavage/methylation domain-containing protein